MVDILLHLFQHLWKKTGHIYSELLFHFSLTMIINDVPASAPKKEKKLHGPPKTKLNLSAMNS